MVTVISYSVAENASGKKYIVLAIQGDLEMVQSKESGGFYASVKKTRIPCALDESAVPRFRLIKF